MAEGKVTGQHCCRAPGEFHAIGGHIQSLEWDRIYVVTVAVMAFCSFVWTAHVSYHLDDVIVGTISFLLVRIKLKQMELAIVRSEFADNGSGLSTGSTDASLARCGLHTAQCCLQASHTHVVYCTHVDTLTAQKNRNWKLTHESFLESKLVVSVDGQITINSIT